MQIRPEVRLLGHGVMGKLIHLFLRLPLMKYRPMFLPQLLRETIWSLNLLFPTNDKDTVDFLTRKAMRFHNDPPYNSHTPFDLNEYEYWRKRLYQLRQIYTAQPKSLRVALMDKRNTLQLYTFWTALIIFSLTIIFGFISSVTAVISTRAALRSVDVALQALQLQMQQ